MKYIIFAFALLILPVKAFATEVKFSSFNINIPDEYTFLKTNTALEVFDVERKNLLLILILPEANKGLDEYTDAIVSEYKAINREFDEESQSHSFTFEDADFGECIGITKELKNKYVFINVGGSNKEIMLEIANTLK